MKKSIKPNLEKMLLFLVWAAFADFGYKKVPRCHKDLIFYMKTAIVRNF